MKTRITELLGIEYPSFQAALAPGAARIRQLKTAFSEKYEAAERAGASRAELDALFQEYSLKQAALRGDVEWGKVEAGQSAGLVHDIVPAGELFRRLVAET